MIVRCRYEVDASSPHALFKKRRGCWLKTYSQDSHAACMHGESQIDSRCLAVHWMLLSEILRDADTRASVVKTRASVVCVVCVIGLIIGLIERDDV